MSALRRAHAEPLRRPLEWDFERIIPGHGDVIEDAGHDAIRAAWLTRD